MAGNEQLMNRIREAFADLPDVEEKKMFRGTTFMVNGKMCISVSSDEIMCRIGPTEHDRAIEKNGVREMIHGGKTMKGFVHVSEAVLKNKKDLDHWLKLSLDFNTKAKAAKKKK